MYYTFFERATSLLYNDAKIMYERNEYFELDALKETCVKTTDTFSGICEYYLKKNDFKKFMQYIFQTEMNIPCKNQNHST